MDSNWSWAMRAGAKAVAPQLIGVIPFGLVAGATPADGGLGVTAAAGFSSIMFAGASQLAAIDVLTHGGTVLVAVLAAITINLRMVLYSAYVYQPGTQPQAEMKKKLDLLLKNVKVKE